MKKTTKTAGLVAAAAVAVGGALLGFSPETDQSRSLGTAETRWGPIYTTEINDGRGNAVTIAELAERNHSALTPESRAAADAHPIGAITGLSAALRPATQVSPGLMSPDDKTKLDNVETILSSAVLAEAAVRAEADDDLEQRITNEAEARMAFDNTTVQYDEAGGITLPAGTGVKVSVPGEEEETVVDVLKTDAAGNATLGAAGKQVDLAGLPTAPLAAPGTSTLQIANTQFVEGATNDAVEIAKTYADGRLAYKADLVGGKVPPEQLPDTARLWRVADSAELPTLTDASVNDNAYVVNSNPAKLYKLIAEPPTAAANWMDISNTGSVVSVAGKTGAVTLYTGDISGLQTVLDDTAKMSDLAGKASTHNQTFTGIIEVPTATSNDDSLRAANTRWVNDRLASGNAATATTLQTARTIQTNLGSTAAAAFNGSANVTPGVTGTLPIASGGTGATTAAAALSALGVKAAGAATVSVAGTSGLAVYAPDTAPATVRNQAVTPAGLAAAIGAIPPPVPTVNIKAYARVEKDGTLVNSYGISSCERISAGRYRLTFSTPAMSTNYLCIGSLYLNIPSSVTGIFGTFEPQLAASTTEYIDIKTTDHRAYYVDEAFSMMVIE